MSTTIYLELKAVEAADEHQQVEKEAEVIEHAVVRDPDARPRQRGVSTMTSLRNEPIQNGRGRSTQMPPIGIWWPMLDGDLKREILDDPSAPLSTVVVRRIFDLCGLDIPIPYHVVRLGEAERAYIAGWSHKVDWN